MTAAAPLINALEESQRAKEKKQYGNDNLPGENRGPLVAGRQWGSVLTTGCEARARNEWGRHMGHPAS